MAIANVVERGNNVYLYNESGQLLTSISTGGGPGDGLRGFTATTVSIRRGAYIYMYNARGQLTGSVPAR